MTLTLPQTSSTPRKRMPTWLKWCIAMWLLEAPVLVYFLVKDVLQLWELLAMFGSML